MPAGHGPLPRYPRSDAAYRGHPISDRVDWLLSRSIDNLPALFYGLCAVNVGLALVEVYVLPEAAPWQASIAVAAFLAARYVGHAF